MTTCIMYINPRHAMERHPPFYFSHDHPTLVAALFACTATPIKLTTSTHERSRPFQFRTWAVARESRKEAVVPYTIHVAIT
jgi:hypothetical protein